MPDFHLVAVRDGAGVEKGERVTDAEKITAIMDDHERARHFVRVATSVPVVPVLEG